MSSVAGTAVRSAARRSLLQISSRQASALTNSCSHACAGFGCSTSSSTSSSANCSSQHPPGRRGLSTSGAPRKIDPDASATEGGGGYHHAQDFVKERLEPGEWDEDRTDPTHRPAWKPKQKGGVKIMSAEDFAARPKAGFGEEFASLHDAMAIMSWMTQEDRENIYSMYCDLMKTMSAEGRGVTSHEYAMRAIAQRFNLSAARVAAIVQLEHEEDRIRRDHPDRKIHYDIQKYVDAKMQEHIADAYRTFGETPPTGFVEDPMGSAGYGNPDMRVSETVAAEDLYDVDDLLAKAVIRERDEAQLAIDSHVYIEDVDYAEASVKVNAECRALMEAKNAVTAEGEGAADGDGDNNELGSVLKRPDDQTPLPDFGRGIGGVWAGKVEPTEDGAPPRRPRYKYVAKIINTRAEKLSPDERSRKKARSRRKKKAAALGIAADEDVQNTLAEIDGILRPATAEEASNVAWRPSRNAQEFTYQGVKRAWIGQKFRGEKGGWGRVERDLEKEEEIDKKLAAKSAEAAMAAAAAAGGGGKGRPPKRLSAQAKRDKARQYKGIRCFNCGGNHAVYDCPKEAHSGEGKCWTCGSADHIAKDCPQKAAAKKTMNASE